MNGTEKTNPAGRRHIRVFVTACLLLIAASAAAEETRRVPLEHATVQQKAQFLHNLVTESFATRAIEESGYTPAKAKLGTARALVKEAQQDLAAGRLKAADDKLNRALELMTSQGRELTEQRLKKEHLARTFRKRLSSVRSFLSAYGRVTKEKGQASTAAARREGLSRLVEEAEAMEREDRLPEAKAVLDRAYKEITRLIRELRDGETLVRRLAFDSPAEEYRYEIDRNDSHVMLLKLALSERPPPSTLAERIERQRERATELRRRAEQQAGEDNYEAAIGTLNDSTKLLIEIIRMSGLYIPG